MLIGGLQKTTLIDYPGKIACTVFTLGCNFRCRFCSNPELVLPSKIKKQPRISEKEFFAFLKEKRGLLDGIVLCGGEPTLNKDLPDFIKKIRKLGFLVKLDTNGSNPEMLKKLIKQKLIDCIAMDVKAPLTSQKYEAITGIKIDLGKIKKSMEIIKYSGIDGEFRTTVVPGIHTKEDIIQIAKDIAPAKKYFLQNFQPGKTVDPKLVKLKSFSKDFLLEIVREIAPLFEICRVR